MFIFDQYNRKSEESDFKSFFNFFSKIANANILITTNTDSDTEILKLPWNVESNYKLSEKKGNLDVSATYGTFSEDYVSENGEN